MEIRMDSEDNPLEMIWKSIGIPLDIMWTSLEKKTIGPFGNPLGIHWKSLETPWELIEDRKEIRRKS